MSNTEKSLFSDIYELPALNWIFFELYFSLNANTFSSELRENMDFLVRLKGLNSLGKKEEVEKLIDNQYGALAREEVGSIPFVCLAHDCLLENVNKTVSDFQSEVSSFSYSNVSLEECRDTVSVAFEFFNDELEKAFEGTPLFKRKSSNDKRTLMQRISKLQSLEFSEDAVNEYAFEMLKLFLRNTDVPKMQDFKATYLRNIGNSLQVFGFNGLEDLAKITVYDYYAALNRKREEYLAHKELLQKR